MDHALWRQWQELASLWAPAHPDLQARFGREGAFGLGSSMDAAERFTAAARSFLDGAGHAAPPPSMGDSPAFGATREHQQRWQRMAEASRRIDDAQRRLQRLWSDVLREAAAAFAARLVSPHPSGISADYTALEFDLGHIGMYISARAQREVPAAIANWPAPR